MSNAKWTQEIRGQVFGWLQAGIGRIDPDQPTLFSSAEGRKRALTMIVEKLTNLHGPGFTVNNVDMQVEWALTQQAKVQRRLVKQYILCKAAALEAGLISHKNFPPSVEFCQ